MGRGLQRSRTSAKAGFGRAHLPAASGLTAVPLRTAPLDGAAAWTEGSTLVQHSPPRCLPSPTPRVPVAQHSPPRCLPSPTRHSTLTSFLSFFQSFEKYLLSFCSKSINIYSLSESKTKGFIRAVTMLLRCHRLFKTECGLERRDAQLKTVRLQLTLHMGLSLADNAESILTHMQVSNACLLKQCSNVQEYYKLIFKTGTCSGHALWESNLATRIPTLFLCNPGTPLSAME